jgi:hypothetical protein
MASKALTLIPDARSCKVKALAKANSTKRQGKRSCGLLPATVHGRGEPWRERIGVPHSVSVIFAHAGPTIDSLALASSSWARVFGWDVLPLHHIARSYTPALGWGTTAQELPHPPEPPFSGGERTQRKASAFFWERGRRRWSDPPGEASDKPRGARKGARDLEPRRNESIRSVRRSCGGPLKSTMTEVGRFLVFSRQPTRGGQKARRDGSRE